MTATVLERAVIDPNSIVLEHGITVADLLDRPALCAALAKLEADIAEIRAQLDNPSEVLLAQADWRPRAEAALRWKKRGLAAVRQRLTIIREENRRNSGVAMPHAMDAEQELFRLARAWCEACDACNADPKDYGSGETDPNLQAMYRLEDEAASIRPTTLRALAVKILILAAYDAITMDEHIEEVFVDAAALAGPSAPWPASRARPAHAHAREASAP